MDIKSILWDWRYVIIFILAVIIFSVFEWGKVKELAISGALMAKKLAKEALLDSGQQQENWVVSRFYPLLPFPARVVISEEVFRKIVKYLYDKARDYVDDGEFNNSVKIL